MELLLGQEWGVIVILTFSSSLPIPWFFYFNIAYPDILFIRYVVDHVWKICCLLKVPDLGEVSLRLGYTMCCLPWQSSLQKPKIKVKEAISKWAVTMGCNKCFYFIGDVQLFIFAEKLLPHITLTSSWQMLVTSYCTIVPLSCCKSQLQQNFTFTILV